MGVERKPVVEDSEPCPKCGSTKKLQGIDTTCLAIHGFIDTQGRKHEHDSNKAYDSVYCAKCKHFLYIVGEHIFTCWCGWTSK